MLLRCFGLLCHKVAGSIVLYSIIQLYFLYSHSHSRCFMHPIQVILIVYKLANKFLLVLQFFVFINIFLVAATASYFVCVSITLFYHCIHYPLPVDSSQKISATDFLNVDTFGKFSARLWTGAKIKQRQLETWP